MEEETWQVKSELFDELHPVTQTTTNDDELPPRPHTVMSGNLHSSSFRIIDNFSRKYVNPSPVVQQHSFTSSSSDMKDQILSPRRLREVSGIDDLSLITYIELSMNTTTTSIGNFGGYLPNLQQLSLSRSIVHSIRDLGTSLGSLRVLWMAKCRLRDLDGLAALPSLQELYVANNEISDVSLVSLLSELEVLDLESNFLTDSDQLGYLCLCQKLMVLSLANNPISSTIIASKKDYRGTIREAIPQLKILDEVPFDDVDTSCLRSTSSYSLMSASSIGNWRDANKGILSPHSIQEKEAGFKNSKGRTHFSTFGGRQLSTVTEKSVDDSLTEESISDLTHGLNQVICGNPIRALRNRQKNHLSSQSITVMSSSESEVTSDQVKQLDKESDSRLITDHQQQLQVLTISPPPGVPPPRPHTASDFRSRRYRVQKHSRSLPTTPDPIQEVPTEKGRDDSTNELLLTVKTKPVRTRRVYQNPTIIK